MPDLDHVPYNVRRNWRKSGTVAAVSGRQDHITVADCSEKAMAAALRQGAAEHLGLLGEALSVAPTERPGEVDSVVGTLPRPWVVGIGRCFVDAARLLARGLAQPDNADHPVGLAELTTNGLRRMAWQQCFGPMEPDVVPGLFASSGDYHGYVLDCLNAIRFDQLVDQLLSRPSPSAIRAPRRRRPRKTTKELLHEPI